MLALAFGLAYLLGAIPFGLLLTRAAGLGDIRQIGSGNIGATNVLRTGRKGLAFATMLLDGGKGAVAVVVARYLADENAALLAGIGAVVGHLFPIWLTFKGGKGVATALGVFFIVAWPIGILCGATWLLMAAVFRMSSLASVTCMVVAPLAAWALPSLEASFSGPWQLVVSCAGISLLVIHRHHANIQRLLRGEEPKIGQTKKVP